MRKIKAVYNQHLFTEVQVRFNRLPELGSGEGLPGPWVDNPGGDQPSPTPAGPNLLNVNFVIVFFGAARCVAQHAIFEQSEYAWYSAGLDSTGPPGCMLLHEQTWYNIDDDLSGLDVMIFDYEGNVVKNAYELGSPVFPQCVKKIGDKIWFSCTDSSQSSNAGIYTIPWDEALESYPVDSADLVIDMPYNWKVVERKIDGEIFFCGLAGDSWDPPPPGPHSIFYFDKQSGSTTKIVEIGGYSCGFAFDSDGNLWSGEYLLDFDDGMQILPCRLGMWTKESVDWAIAGSLLSWADASVVIELGTHPEIDLNWGVSDVEADDRGNIYVSLNTYEAFDPNNEYGAVIKVFKNEGDIYHKEFLLLSDNTGNDNWDWFRGLTFDGSNLLLDCDHNQLDPDSSDVLYLVNSIT